MDAIPCLIAPDIARYIDSILRNQLAFFVIGFIGHSGVQLAGIDIKADQPENIDRIRT